MLTHQFQYFQFKEGYLRTSCENYSLSDVNLLISNDLRKILLFISRITQFKKIPKTIKNLKMEISFPTMIIKNIWSKLIYKFLS